MAIPRNLLATVELPFLRRVDSCKFSASEDVDAAPRLVTKADSLDHADWLAQTVLREQRDVKNWRFGIGQWLNSTDRSRRYAASRRCHDRRIRSVSVMVQILMAVHTHWPD